MRLIHNNHGRRGGVARGGVEREEAESKGLERGGAERGAERGGAERGGEREKGGVIRASPLYCDSEYLYSIWKISASMS